MKQVCSLVGLSVLLSACCLAQSARDALAFLTPLRDASQVQNADQYADHYAALFASDGRWDGPIGQNAIGPLNIKAAVDQFFTEFGPLREVQAGARQLSPDIVLADVYQMIEGSRHASLDRKLIARGSGTPPPADFRTTLVLRKEGSGWNIIAARVADLRAERR